DRQLQTFLSAPMSWKDLTAIIPIINSNAAIVKPTIGIGLVASPSEFISNPLAIRPIIWLLNAPVFSEKGDKKKVFIKKTEAIASVFFMRKKLRPFDQFMLRTTDPMIVAHPCRLHKGI